MSVPTIPSTKARFAFEGSFSPLEPPTISDSVHLSSKDIPSVSRDPGGGMLVVFVSAGEPAR